MPDTKSVVESDLLRATDAALARQRRRTVVLTALPVIGAIVFVAVVTAQVSRLESQRRLLAVQATELEEKAARAQAQEAKLTQAMRDAGQQLTELIRTTRDIEDLIESKQSFLRSLDEARFLIAIRMRFDKIHEALDRLGDIAPELKTARSWRTWVTVLASAPSPSGLTVSDAMQACMGPTARTAVLRSPNGFYALAVLGDGTFTTAYDHTVSFQTRGCAPGAYFAHTEGWTEAGTPGQRP